MNYRHDYHIGNFADVFKHIVLVRMIEYMKLKDKAFRVYDTHAGSGNYVLANEKLDEKVERWKPKEKKPEWIDGIGKVMQYSFSKESKALLAPYMDILNEGWNSTPRTYPGSPLIAYHAMREKDRLSASELHPDAYATLKTVFQDNYQAKILNLDGWLIPGSQTPPKESRGLMLIDPPFEEQGEFQRLINAVYESSKRWSGGTIALWYPLKHQMLVNDFKSVLSGTSISNLICLEFEIDKPGQTPTLYGCGMIIRNAPYPLMEEMKKILPELTKCLETFPGAGRWRVTRLTDE